MKEQKKMIKTNEEVVPNEEEIEEAGAESHGFKVKKGPRIMTSEEVRNEGPVQKSYRSNETVVNSQPIQPKPVQPIQRYEDDEGYPEHESFSLRPEPKKSLWQEGTYEVRIDRAWQLIEKDNFHKDPETGEAQQAVFMHILFVTSDGGELEGRTSMSRHQDSNLTALLKAIFGEDPDMDIGSDDLVGRHLQIIVKNKVSKTTGNEYPAIVTKGYLRSAKQFQTADQ